MLIFTSSKILGIKQFKNENLTTDFFDLKNRLNENNQQIISKRPYSTMKSFFKNFNWIKAAGGVVEKDNEVLFIYRLGKWDLPKGKIEKNETKKNAAIREIKEETGIEGEFEITKKINESYHVYFAFEKSYIKKTTWYKIEYTGNKNVNPQLSEGITKVKWLNKKEMKIAMNETYPNIKGVLIDVFS